MCLFVRAFVFVLRVFVCVFVRPHAFVYMFVCLFHVLVDDVEDYSPPYGDLVPHPSLGAMKDVVCVKKLRPPIPALWTDHEVSKSKNRFTHTHTYNTSQITTISTCYPHKHKQTNKHVCKPHPLV